MSKQVIFYATDEDKSLIEGLLNSVFGQLINVLSSEEQPVLFDSKDNQRKFYLVERSRKDNIVYIDHEYYNGSIARVLDYRKSPVLEYSIASKNLEGRYFIEGRFYCCSEDLNFSKLVSKFFTKLKKEFWYVKRWSSYVSKDIDVENSLFLISNKIVKIGKEDLK